MRTMLKVSFPAVAGSRVIKDGSLPKMVESFIQHYKPEAAYFLPSDGKRTMMFVFDMPDATHLPSVGEPLFAGLEADIWLSPVMNLDDLRVGLEGMMKK